MPAEDRVELIRWTRTASLRAGLAQRARIVLLADEGMGTAEIVERVGVSKPTVIGWKKRYAAEGVGGLDDRPKPGRPAVLDEVAVVLATLEAPPDTLGVTHWSSRLLADHLGGISNVWVARIWHAVHLAHGGRGALPRQVGHPRLHVGVRHVGQADTSPSRGDVLRQMPAYCSAVAGLRYACPSSQRYARICRPTTQSGGIAHDPQRRPGQDQKGSGNVMYIPAVPGCPRNETYAAAVREAFITGSSSSDFPDEL
jgi:transposase